MNTAHAAVVLQPEDADAKLVLGDLLTPWDSKTGGAIADLIEQVRQPASRMLLLPSLPATHTIEAWR